MRTIGNIERFLVIGIVVVIGAILAVAIKGADDLEGAYKKQVQAKSTDGKRGGGTPLSKSDPMRGTMGPAGPASQKSDGKNEGASKPSERGTHGTDPARLSAELDDLLNNPKKRADGGHADPATPPDGTVQKPEDDPKVAPAAAPNGGDANGAGVKPESDAGAPVVIKDDPKVSPDPTRKTDGGGVAAGAGKPGPDPAKVDPTTAAIAWTYEVQPGDRLERIASTLYGDRSMWKSILDVNPAFTDPTRIRAGSVLTLPRPPTNTTAVGLAHGVMKVAAAGPADAHHDSKVSVDDKAKPDAIAATDSAKSTSFKRVTSSDQYEVQKGDTLMAIAATHYGTRSAWRMILGANTERISDKDHIKPGTVLKLPAQ